MQKASGSSVHDAIPALRLLHRDESQAVALGRPGGARREQHENTRVVRAAMHLRLFCIALLARTQRPTERFACARLAIPRSCPDKLFAERRGARALVRRTGCGALKGLQRFAAALLLRDDGARLLVGGRLRAIAR